MMYPSVRRWLQEKSLVEPTLLEGAGLEALVGERIASFGGTESQYVAELDRSPDEVDCLIAGIAVPETWLFRYPRSYDLLLEFCERRLVSGAPAIRLLSVGCATGQEAYCLAMTAIHAGWPCDRVEVLGIDRNSGFLRIAERGEYSSSSIRTEIPAWAVPFMHRHGDAIRIDSSVRATVRFSRIDINSPLALAGLGPFDAVFCRNVLIYLNSDARTRLMNSLVAELALNGLCFVGHAEQLMRGEVPLRAVNSPHTFALERGGASEIVTARSVENLPRLTEPSRPRASLIESPAKTSAPTSVISRLTGEPVAESSIEDARELADAGRMQDAETLIRRILSLHGPDAAAMELLGMVRMALNDSEGAKRLFEQAVYLQPDRSASLLQLALISERAGDHRRAANYWQRARRVGPDGQGRAGQ